jgi:hypothetical protein
LDTGGNVFGGFTPLQWESRTSDSWKCDDSLKSFVFTLKNPHNIPARKFALKAEKKQQAVRRFWIDDCNANTDSSTSLGHTDTNDTGLDRNIIFTGSFHFHVREIEVFEITD